MIAIEPHPGTPVQIPVQTDDPINAKILSVSEDKIAGFDPDPIATIARVSGVDLDTTILRIRAMMKAGVIRRVRQTLLANKLATGSLVAWKVPDSKLQYAFETLFADDPFSGHVVIRSTDTETPGSSFRLWTTLKVPQTHSMEKHCQWWAHQIGATEFRLMPAKKLFALGVGHVRRRELVPGDKTDTLSEPIGTEIEQLTSRQWQVVIALKRELTPEEVGPGLWDRRATEAGFSLEEFLSTVQSLASRGVIGRFSTFLEHHKKLTTGERVTKFNALFHWAVPRGREIEAGQQLGRFHCMTHAYWREGGPEFADVNVMGVSHGQEKQRVLEHKNAIDQHLESVGIPVSYTNVFWGGRSEIKPSEITPDAYTQWCESVGESESSFRL